LIVKEGLKLLRSSLPTTIEIRRDIHSQGIVMADPSQIHQVLMNICTNAGQAMQQEGGVLKVGLLPVDLDADFVRRDPDMKPGPYLKLTISDTGPGIAPEVMDRIFDPFFTTKRKGEGTGLGLAVVHGIVRSHGGTIRVYSEPDKGATVEVYLPVVEERLEPRPEGEKPLPGGTEHILFVDDEDALLKIGRQMLERLGYTVTTRMSSLEALALFKREPGRFDLVITDQTMPHMTGDNLAKELLRIRPEIPIVVCTGFSHNIDESKALSMGIKALIMKPLIMRTMAETVRTVLDSEAENG